MPWQASVFTTRMPAERIAWRNSTVVPLLWPLYSMRDAAEGKLAFDFKTHVEAGKDDPDRQVLVIDYADIESNPRPLIRSIRDELVEIVDSVFLGKILYHSGSWQIQQDRLLRAAHAGLIYEPENIYPPKTFHERQLSVTREWKRRALAGSAGKGALSRSERTLRQESFTRPKVCGPRRISVTPPRKSSGARTPDGTWNDLSGTGLVQTWQRFRSQCASFDDHHRPQASAAGSRTISRRLMARDTFKPVGILSAISAAWIQFENHNWFFHGDGVPEDDRHSALSR